MRRENLTGLRFGRLVVTGYSGSATGRRSLWKCQCDCGKVVHVRAHAIKRGATKSCGCLKVTWNSSGSARRRHGLSGTPEYAAWCDMRRRCLKTFKDHADYFDRGIRVCEEWNDTKLGASKFIEYVGKRPSRFHSLDRIDNDKGYEPENVRWATKEVQLANRRKVARIDQFTTAEINQELKRRGAEVVRASGGSGLSVPLSGSIGGPYAGKELAS